MNEEKFKEQYRAGRLRAENKKSDPEGLFENLTPDEKKARKEGYYERKNELKQEAKKEVIGSLTHTSSDSDDSYTSTHEKGGFDLFDTGVCEGDNPILVAVATAAGALLLWLGWLGVTGATTFSLVWFLGLISGLCGILLLIPFAYIIVLCCIWLFLFGVFAAFAALGLYLIYLLLKLIWAIIKHFANNLY